jgi:hypothetical protein
MTELRELTNPGKRFVERKLEEGTRLTEVDREQLQEYSAPLSGLTADLGGLREELDEIREDMKEGNHEIDAAAAPPVREHLTLTRREAANPRLWHWLAVAEFPKFVYHRWEKYSSIQEKFLAAGRDIYSNALHRLWWGAELTSDGDDFERTERMFEQGELANDVLDRWFARDETAAKVVVDVLSGESADVISNTTRDVKQELSVYTLELMDECEIRALAERKLKEEKSD